MLVILRVVDDVLDVVDLGVATVGLRGPIMIVFMLIL